MHKSVERYLAFGFGVIFLIVILVLATQFPRPTPFQYTVFRIVLALAAGGCAAMIPGFLTVSFSKWLRAGGALAVFVIVFFKSPAGLTGVEVKSEQQVEVEKPVISWSSATVAPRSSDPSAYAGSTGAPQSLVVTRADQLLDHDVWGKRYQSLTIDGVRAHVPNGATIVANEVDAIRGGVLVGTDFSVVARRLSNATVDVSGTREPETPPGTARLYVKLVENSRVLAVGAPGVPGQAGTVGADGVDGGNGRDGRCDGFGGYRGADAGGNGGDAGNGSDGQPGGDGQDGGLVVLTTVVSPIGSVIDVFGGQPGSGGHGGTAGTPGRGGAGGRGCTGLGGTQSNRADGRPGRAGQSGNTGPIGRPGNSGEYRLKIVPSFDQVLEKVRAMPNSQLGAALASP